MEFKEDPKFSVIMPVYDVPEGTFKRCLMSVADQDYPNLEVVIVVNGGDEKAHKMAEEFVKTTEKKALWKVIFTEEKGACQARNLGFKESTGEIVAFVNSDYILKLGCITMWVDALQAHPECGFVYGAYEYASSRREVYNSKPFDRYLLEVANFIDCGFPLWRKHVVEWDPEVKSLQDWDFFLRVSEKTTGYFLGREISFIAEPPRPKGLSMDSSENWMERVKFVKAKNGIPLRDICVTSLGAPNHGVEIAKMIGADFRDDTLHKPHEYKACYLIGWYMHPGEEQNGHSWILERFKNSKKIVHFVGADIYWLRKFSVQNIREFAGALKLSTDKILCENPLAQEELKSFGIEAEIVPIPPYSDFQVSPLTEEFSCAVLLTDKSDFDKYLKEHTLSIIKAMPDVKFQGYGDADLGEFKAANFEMKGQLKRPDYEKFVLANSAYLRIVRHDTTPMASAEFMMAGRRVISNIPNECTDYIDTSGKQLFNQWDSFGPGFSALFWPETKKKIIKAIRNAKNKPFGAEAIQANADYLKERFNKEIYIRKIREMATAPVLEVINS